MLKQRSPRDFSYKSGGWLIFLGILAGYALFIIPTINRLGIGWDEATDLVIADAYQTPRGMFLGVPWDLSQTRLPMFAVALMFRLLGTSNLITARLTTVLVGGLTLLGLFVMGNSVSRLPRDFWRRVFRQSIHSSCPLPGWLSQSRTSMLLVLSSGYSSHFHTWK